MAASRHRLARLYSRPMDADWTQGEFWATAGQVISVLGLALVLEARAVAKSWRLDRPVQRRVEASVVVLVALALLFAFSDTLAALARHRDLAEWRVVSASIVMLAAFGILAMSAALTVATRGTMDVGLALERLIPWSASNRARRLIKSTRRQLPMLRSEAEALIPQARALLDRARSEAKRRGRLSADDSTEVRAFLRAAKSKREGGRHPKSIDVPRLSRAFKEYTAKPTAGRARAVREARARVALRMLALVRLHHVTSIGMDEVLDEHSARLDERPYSDAERKALERYLLSASEPGFFPWSPTSDEV